MTLQLTQTQWANQIRTFVPQWYFENPDLQEAYVQGLAAVLAAVHQDVYDHFDETMLLTATGDFLDAHGEERSIPRIEGEFDDQYRVRVRNMANQSNCPSLKRIVDALLMVGTATFVEDYNQQLFFNREETFFNRGLVFLEQIYNAFSIIVDKQLHEPFSFLNREYFANREDFVGQAESSQYVFDLILEAVNSAKACGAFYRIIERLET